jgi:hypothetical protein
MIQREICVSILTSALCASAIHAAHAQQADQPVSSAWSFSVGLKAWANEWTSWEVNRVQLGGSSLQALTPISSDTSVAFTPFASARYERFFVSAGYMTPTEYTLEGSLGTRKGIRTEIDANLGYDVLPGVAVTTGYKRLSQDVGGTFRWSGPTVAASVSAPLVAGVGVYGTYGLGWFKVKLPAPDSDGHTSLNANYSLSEFGLTYSLGRARFAGVASLTFALGYRSQTVRTRNYALASQPVGGGTSTTYAHDDPRDFTQGITLTVIGSF